MNNGSNTTMDSVLGSRNDLARKAAADISGYDWFDVFEDVFIVSVYSSIAVLGFALNAFVLVTFVTKPSLRNSTSILVVGLACADLVFVICIPPLMVAKVADNWPFGRGACKAWYYMKYASSIASAYNLVVLAVDRFLATVYCTMYHKRRKTLHGFLALVVVWVFACSISSIAAIQADVRQYKWIDQNIRRLADQTGADVSRLGVRKIRCLYKLGKSDKEKLPDQEGRSTPTSNIPLLFHLGYFSVQYVVPAILILCLYVRIVGKLRAGSSALKKRCIQVPEEVRLEVSKVDDVEEGEERDSKEGRGTEGDSKRKPPKSPKLRKSASKKSLTEKRAKRVTKMAVRLVVVFLICWLPLHVCMLLFAMRWSVIHETAFILCALFSNAFAYLLTIFNPLFYALMTEQFRKALKMCLWDLRTGSGSGSRASTHCRTSTQRGGSSKTTHDRRSHGNSEVSTSRSPQLGGTTAKRVSVRIQERSNNDDEDDSHSQSNLLRVPKFNDGCASSPHQMGYATDESDACMEQGSLTEDKKPWDTHGTVITKSLICVEPRSWQRTFRVAQLGRETQV